MSRVHVASVASGGLAGVIALIVAASLIVLRILASASFFPQYLDVSIASFALGVLQVGAFGAVLVYAARGRGGATRTGLLFGVSLVLVLEGLAHAGAMDIVGVWLVPSGLTGLIAAGLSVLEVDKRLRASGMAVLVVVCSYTIVWLLDRLALTM